jgi:hypothetical protein
VSPFGGETVAPTAGPVVPGSRRAQGHGEHFVLTHLAQGLVLAYPTIQEVAPRESSQNRMA